MYFALLTIEAFMLIVMVFACGQRFLNLIWVYIYFKECLIKRILENIHCVFI